MVKIHCDRCKKEITGEHYYTINIGKVPLYPKYDYSITGCASAVSAYNYEQEKSPYEKLSSQIMYCKRCAEDIEYTLNHYTEAI